jgi:hypothetical protein
MEQTMGKRIVRLSAALVGLLYAHALLAAEPACPDRENLLASVKWLKLEIAGGRLSLRSDRCTQSRLRAESPEQAAVRQSLAVEMAPRGIVLRYERADAAGHVQLEADERRLTLSRLAAEPASSASCDVRYVQPASGKITLTLGGPRPRTIAADDLWQLLLAERELCREHLLPLLVEVAPQWDLDGTLDAIERRLVAGAGRDVLTELQQWQRWVDELASPEFVHRQAADRDLRGCGQPVLAFLRQCEARRGAGQLDAEQRRRVRAILIDLPDGRADCAQRVASWLAGDRRVWLALLSRGDLEQRIAAAEHLSRLCNKPVAFNPEAPPPERDAQLAALAALLVDH